MIWNDSKLIGELSSRYDYFNVVYDPINGLYCVGPDLSLGLFGGHVGMQGAGLQADFRWGLPKIRAAHDSYRLRFTWP